MIVPIVNIWWEWKYSQGVERVSGGRMSGAVAFLLLFLLGQIGTAVLQATYNSFQGQAQGHLPQARAA